MSITPRQIGLVQQSFAKVEPIADAAAEIFYGKLFALDPSLRQLFKRDMKEQGRMLMAVLKAAVGSLERLDGLVPVLHKLADRHVDYGVKPEHYAPVGQALLDTLAQGLGPEFTPETRAAWVAVYELVAQTMCAHSYPGFVAKRAKERGAKAKKRAAV